MNSQSNADSIHSQVILLRMQGKSTEELQAIWQENDESKWSKEDFDAVQKVLLERVGKLPEQKIIEKTDELIKSSNQNLSMSKSVLRKYPYLTGYVGFVALSFLFGKGLNFIPFLSQFGFIFQLIGGFFIFKFIVDETVLPYIPNKQSQAERLQLEQSPAQKWKSKLFLFGMLFFLMSVCGYFELVVGMVPGGLGGRDASRTLLNISYETLLNISSFIMLFFPVGAVITLIAAYIMHKNNYHANANTLLYTLIVVYLISFSIILYLLWIPRG